MKDLRITRRQALHQLAALSALPLIGCGAETGRDRLVALRRDRRSAALLGRVWLDAQDRAPDAAELVARICAESECAGLADDPDHLRRFVAERHHSDFERGKLVSVDGWMLSETEVVLCALVAIGD